MLSFWQEYLVNEVLAEGFFRNTGALLEHTHVVLSSGKHADSYLRREILMQDRYGHIFERLCGGLAAQLCCLETELGVRINFITGPAEGGMEVARHAAVYIEKLLGRQIPILPTFKDTREGRAGEFTLDVAPDGLKGLTGVMFEDVVTTGGSSMRAIAPFRMAGAEIVGLLAFFNREGKTAKDLGVRVFRSLLDRQVASYDVPKGMGCGLCAHRIHINTDEGVGRGAEFVAQHGQPSTWTEERIALERFAMQS